MKKNIIKIIKDILDINQHLTGNDYLKELVKNIAINLDVQYVLIGHPLNNELVSIQTDVIWAKDKYVDNFVYNLKDTPCEIVLSGERVCIHENNVCQDFPDDLLLQEMGIEAYIGAPVTSKESSGVSSILVLLDTKPMEDKDFFIAITDFLAVRASAELDKQRIEEKLKHEVALRTQELEDANHEIESINQNLEQRVKEEIAKNEQKQRIISEQSKMALMGEMIENIAHQWKQPLSTIKVHATGIKLSHELNSLDDKMLMQSMDDITLSTDFLTQTINDFKDFFKNNKIKEEFYLKEVIEKTLKLMSSRLRGCSIQVYSNIGNIHIEGFANEFIQVILNILSNAYDELENINQAKKIILIDVIEDNESILVQIKDNAGGVDLEVLPRIFEPYVSTKKENGGTGIGLYMSKEIIEKHMAGTIDVENVQYDYEGENYQGALFSIKLPKTLL